MKNLFTIFCWLAGTIFVYAQHDAPVYEDDCSGEDADCRPFIELSWFNAMSWVSEESKHNEHAKPVLEYSMGMKGNIRAFRSTKYPSLGIGGFTSFGLCKKFLPKPQGELNGEILGGPAFRLKRKMTCYDFGAGAGFTTESHSRLPVATEAYLGITHKIPRINASIEFFGAVNYAPGKFGYHGFLLFYPRDWIGLGLTAQREGTVGPRIQAGYKFIYAFVSGCWNLEAKSPSGMVGLYFWFGED